MHTAWSPPAVSEIRTEAFMLANGMQVVAVPMSRAGVVHHAVYFAFGSADDPPGQSGINHLIEHLMFNGTAAVPEGEYDTIIGRNGGSANAYTSPDVTAYYATIARDRLETVMELEADRMTGLVFDPANFEAERKVVLEERLQRIDNDPRALFREELRAARWRAHPYGRPVIGWRHEIEALTLTQVESFYRRHYGPRNALLVVAGDISADELRPLAERTFGQIPAGGEPLPPRPAEPPHRALIAVEDADPRVAQLRWSRQYRAPKLLFRHPPRGSRPRRAWSAPRRIFGSPPPCIGGGREGRAGRQEPPSAGAPGMAACFTSTPWRQTALAPQSLRRPSMRNSGVW